MRLLIVTLFLCSGCAMATTMVPLNEATPAPSDRVLAFQENPGEGMGVIVITRDKGFLGGGCYFGVAINGKLAARLDVGETARFYVPAGEVLLKVGRTAEGHIPCPDEDTSTWTVRETSVKPSQTKYFRLRISTSGGTDVQRTE